VERVFEEFTNSSRFAYGPPFHSGLMPVLSSPSRFDPAALKELESLEIEYAETRAFRSLLIRRLFIFTVAVLALVVWMGLPWQAAGAAIAMDAAFIVSSVRTELQARRRWMTAAVALATTVRLQSRNGDRTAVPLRDTADGRKRSRPSHEAARRSPGDPPGVERH
jgi:hypothetical protein